MLLEVNVRGEWRTVAEFDPDRTPEVQDAAATLKRAVGDLQLRLVDEAGNASYLNERGVFRGQPEDADLDCPIASGADRTTDGWIGQP